MSSDLEAKLAQVPERWRDATRTRVWAVMDYLAAGEHGPVLVDVLSRRVGVTTSAFYALVRRWKQFDGDVTAMAPWARRPDSKPRIPRESTAHIDAVVMPLIAEAPDRPTEPVAQGLLASWPEELTRPGISYVRRRVNQLRADHQKKTRRRPVRAGDGDDASSAAPEPRWPLDVVLVDHVAVEAIVWSGDEATLPLATFAIDSATMAPVGVALGLDEPTPDAVILALADLAAVAVQRGAPGPPTIVVSTTFARGWPEMSRALEGTGANVVVRRSKKLSFGPEANRMLGGAVGDFRLAPRLGHRPREERATTRAILTLPKLELADFDGWLRAYVRDRREDVVAERSWPPAARPEPSSWSRLAELADGSSKDG